MLCCRRLHPPALGLALDESSDTLCCRAAWDFRWCRKMNIVLFLPPASRGMPHDAPNQSQAVLALAGCWGRTALGHYSINGWRAEILLGCGTWPLGNEGQRAISSSITENKFAHCRFLRDRCSQGRQEGQQAQWREYSSRVLYGGGIVLSCTGR